MKGRGALLAAIVAAALCGAPEPAVAGPLAPGCCIEGCGSTTPPWQSCGNGPHCTGGFCPGDIGSAVSFDPSATCGQGAFSGCPATETGQCTDGVDNDAWTEDGLTDCADPDCAGDPACSAAAPAMGKSGLMFLFLALIVLGGLSFRSRPAGAARARSN